MLKTGHGLCSSRRILFQLQLQETSVETQAAQQPLQLHSTCRAWPNSQIRIPNSHLQSAFLRPRGDPRAGVRSLKQELHRWGRRAGSGSAQRLDAGAWPPPEGFRIASESANLAQLPYGCPFGTTCKLAARIPHYSHILSLGESLLYTFGSVCAQSISQSSKLFSIVPTTRQVMWHSVHSRLAMGPICLLCIEETPQCRSCFGLGAEALLDSCARWWMGSNPFQQQGSEQHPKPGLMIK